MTEERRSSGTDQMAEEAARWFVRLQDAAASGDDWLAFEAWLTASPDHQDAYDRAERLWLELEESQPVIARALDVPAPAGARRASPVRAPTRLSRRGWLGAAAAIAATIVAGVGIATRMQPAPFQTYRTAPGETREVALADGTRIHMNAESSLRVSLGKDARQVEMADAEAVFDVAHDPTRPFLITVGDRQVRVVGTEFNLRHRARDVVLTVRRGIVEVRPASRPDARATRVTVGQQLVHTDGQQASVLTTPGADAAFAWTAGQLIYQQQPLSVVAADLSRRFARPVRVADPELGRLRFSGVLVTDNEDDVMRRLEAFAPIRAERTSDGVTLHRADPARTRTP